MAITVAIDDDGYPQVGGISPGHHLVFMITDDIGADLEACDEVLEEIAAVREGRQPRCDMRWNATRLVVDAAGARLTFAFNATNNTPVEVPIEQLVDALAKLRAAIVAAGPRE